MESFVTALRTRSHSATKQQTTPPGGAEGAPEGSQDEAALSARFPWFTDATEQGPVEVGRE